MNPYGNNPASTSRENDADIIEQSGVTCRSDATDKHGMKGRGQLGPTSIAVLLAELAAAAAALPPGAVSALYRLAWP